MKAAIHHSQPLQPSERQLHDTIISKSQPPFLFKPLILTEQMTEDTSQHPSVGLFSFRRGGNSPGGGGGWGYLIVQIWQRDFFPFFFFPGNKNCVIRSGITLSLFVNIILAFQRRTFGKSPEKGQKRDSKGQPRRSRVRDNLREKKNDRSLTDKKIKRTYFRG